MISLQGISREPSISKYELIQNENKISSKKNTEFIQDDKIIIPRKNRWERKLSVTIPDKNF